jgi:hypothetical protein
MVCFWNISVDTLHKGDTEDNDDDNDDDDNYYYYHHHHQQQQEQQQHCNNNVKGKFWILLRTQRSMDKVTAL